MAYPEVKAAYGLRPVKRLDGMPYAGAVRHMPIASGYATGIGYGEPVKRLADGTIATAAAGDTPIGVFVGCHYTDPGSKQKFFNQQWPGGTTAGDALAYVVDDPNVVFQVAVVATASAAVTGLEYKAVGGNVKMKGLGAPNTATGNSVGGVDDATAATTAGHMLRVVDVVEESSFYDSSTKKYREVLVIFNTHQYRTATGVYS